MKKFFKSRKLHIIYSIIAILLMWLVWIIAYHAVGNRLIVPSFGDTMSEFFALFKNSEFWTGLYHTLIRTLIAFLISFALALICVIIAVTGQAARAFLKPVISFVRILPTLAITLLILKWTPHNKNIPPIIVTVLVLFPMIYAQFVAAVDGIDGGIRQMIKVYHIPKTTAVFKIYLPLISPNILSQSGANISFGIKIMVSAEIIGGTLKSLGYLMNYASGGSQIALLSALTLFAVIFGLIIDISISQTARLTYKWSKKEGIR